jgi:hypothetical protein
VPASTTRYSPQHQGLRQRAARTRINIAVDPPTPLISGGKGASMAIHDYSIRGEYIPPDLVEQAKKFIETNRAALLDYREGRIDTEDFLQRVRPIE